MPRESEYASYVHESVARDGRPIFYVGHWDDEHNQYYWPISSRTQRLSGASGAFSRTLTGFGGSYAYRNRKSALNRARLLYGPEA